MPTSTLSPRLRVAGKRAAVAMPATLLCLAVAAIHVVDQGGLPGSKGPGYVGLGYYLLEGAAVVAAGMLLFRPTRPAWLLALAVGAGPLLGYVLSRGPGLPSYVDDRGNWGEALGVASLVVESLLIIVSAWMLRRATPPAR